MMDSARNPGSMNEYYTSKHHLDRQEVAGKEWEG